MADDSLNSRNNMESSLLVRNNRVAMSISRSRALIKGGLLPPRRDQLGLFSDAFQLKHLVFISAVFWPDRLTNNSDPVKGGRFFRASRLEY